MRRSVGLGAAVCALVFLFVMAPTAGAASFTVNTTADTAPDGCTTDPGGCTLREAILAANAAGGDDDVTLPAGRYVFDIEAGALPVDDVADGTLELNGAGAERTIIDANGNSGVFTVAVGSGFEASGVTITGGGGCPCFPDGGILAEEETTVVLTDSIVTKNNGFEGGGISSDGGEVVLVRTEVDHNVSIGGGGGVYIQGGELTVEDSFIHANNTFGAGGGIFSAPVEATQTSGVADPVVTGGTINIESSTISDNTADFDGGGILASSVPNNSRDLQLDGDPAPTPAAPFGELVNTTVSGNVSLDGSGGGVAVPRGSLDILSSTITGNTTFSPVGDGFGGGGVWSFDTPDNGLITFKNSIVSANRSAGQLVNCAGRSDDVFVDDSGNIEDDSTCGFADGSNNTDPRLGPLADNGGPTPTHALRDDSPAIEHGVNSGAPQLDQRGGDRPPADGSAGTTVDSGAYEAYSLADLTVEAKADGPDPGIVGNRLTYTVVLRNNGPDRINGVTLSDALPAAVTAGPSEVNGGGSCTGTYVCEFAQVDVGQVIKATFHTTPTSAGILTNSASIGALGYTDTDPANNSDSAATQVNPVQENQLVPPPIVPPAQTETDDGVDVTLVGPKTVSLETFFKGIEVESECIGELCIRKFREHAAINTGATRIAGFNLTVSRTSLGFTAKKKVKLRPCLSGSSTGRRHRRCLRNLRDAAEKATPFRVKIVVEAVDRAGNRDAEKIFLRVTP